jgi:hypothetical protein
MFSELERARQAFVNAENLNKLAGHYQSPKRSQIGTSDKAAFKKRVAKRRKKKGYK